MADATTAITCSGTFHEYSTSLEQLKGHCWYCGNGLPLRRRHWCSDDCGQWWGRNHDWGRAREAALKRDGHRCVMCQADGVKLEVNHIVPREGMGYGQGCHNHQENLETLCHDCHVGVTRRQRKLRGAK